MSHNGTCSELPFSRTEMLHSIQQNHDFATKKPDAKNQINSPFFRELAGKSVTLATEAVVPLMLHLDQLESTTKESSDYLAWGVCQVSQMRPF